MDRLWEEMNRKDIKLDDVVRQTYRKKKEEFDRKTGLDSCIAI